MASACVASGPWDVNFERLAGASVAKCTPMPCSINSNSPANRRLGLQASKLPSLHLQPDAFPLGRRWAVHAKPPLHNIVMLAAYFHERRPASATWCDVLQLMGGRGSNSAHTDKPHDFRTRAWLSGSVESSLLHGVCLQPELKPKPRDKLFQLRR